MNTANEQYQKKSDVIVATMKRQPLLATCLDAMEEWKRRTAYKACEVSVVNALQDANAAVWIDKPLFNDALADLLEFAARSSVNNDHLKLTVATSGLSSVRVLIDYAPSTAPIEETRLSYLQSSFSDITRQIISQHGGCLEFSEGWQSCRVMIRIS